MSGTLFLVATPIGNLEDITLRALRILGEVDRIACEDTRHTTQLLARHGIATPRLSYHQHNEASRTPQLLRLLLEGKNIALVSDAGTPLLSDPGYRLVRACRDEGIPVVPVPGASAVLAALAGSGLPMESFLFAGFLPPKPGGRRKRLAALADQAATMVFYEAPHRIVATLEDMLEVLGSRPACLARELTKLHEEWLCGTIETILDSMKGREQILGEMTVVVAGAAQTARTGNWPQFIGDHLRLEMELTGAPRMEALKAVARQRGIPRREAYRQLLEETSR